MTVIRDSATVFLMFSVTLATSVLRITGRLLVVKGVTSVIVILWDQSVKPATFMMDNARAGWFLIGVLKQFVCSFVQRIQILKLELKAPIGSWHMPGT